MLSATHFETGHVDLVHDIAYDFYGKRMVTCSSDQRVKVWDYLEPPGTLPNSSTSTSSSSSSKAISLTSGKWVPNDSWKAHDSSILKISWAHPEYGSVFATCSFDKTVRIWEEAEGEAKNSGRRWIERARLADFRGAVQDIEFAPNWVGLTLACMSADATLRIYEALDIMNLSAWTLMEELDLSPTSSHALSIISQSSLNGTLSTMSSPTMTSTLTAPNLYTTAATPFTSSSYSSSSTTTPSSSSHFHSLPHPSTTQENHHRDTETQFCISWWQGRQEPQMLAVGMGTLNSVSILRLDSHNKWMGLDTLTHPDTVTDAAWAPGVGRTFHLLGTSCKDGHVRIWKLSEGGGEGGLGSGGVMTGGSRIHGGYPTGMNRGFNKKKMNAELLADFPDHHSEVWKVEWNITGTILSSSGDDGKVRLWKSSYTGDWHCTAIISAESSKIPS